jgi:hypothetical protein
VPPALPVHCHCHCHFTPRSRAATAVRQSCTLDRRSIDAPFQATTEFRLFQKIVALDFTFPCPFPDLARDFTAEVVRTGYLIN